MLEKPLSGVISWEDHRKEVEAAWHKAQARSLRKAAAVPKAAVKGAPDVQDGSHA